ncbi:MAG TPA: hypothetical protein VG897_13620, partial [Terriglobales bacterium]|nr:hypothetical protein [Terriglobales bacterium]
MSGGNNNDLDLDLVKLATGKTWDQISRSQSARQSIESLVEYISFDSDPRLIGWDSDGKEYNVFDSELDSHMHIMGATQEGKSRFLQLLIREDLQRGIGACLLDPSHNADTAQQLLAWCASTGFAKVCYINHADFEQFDRVPSIQPIKHHVRKEVTIGNIKDAFHVLWGTKPQDVTRIEKYVPAVMEALWAAHLTLADIGPFLDRDRWEERNHILDAKNLSSTNRAHLERAFGNGTTYEQQFSPTINRLNPLADETLSLILGSMNGAVPWQEMIRKGWLVLVNLDPTATWGGDRNPQRLLGTVIITEILYAMDRALAGGWKGRYRLYIDEAGEYVTPKISHVLDLKAKTGLSLALAHQRLDHIEDRNVRSAIEANCKAKFVFFTNKREDRDTMLRNMGYGGDIPDRAVSHEMAQTPKQFTWARVQKRPPRKIEIVEVEDAVISKDDLIAFKKKIYNYPWFYSRQTIKQEISARTIETQSRFS